MNSSRTTRKPQRFPPPEDESFAETCEALVHMLDTPSTDDAAPVVHKVIPQDDKVRLDGCDRVASYPPYTQLL